MPQPRGAAEVHLMTIRTDKYRDTTWPLQRTLASIPAAILLASLLAFLPVLFLGKIFDKDHIHKLFTTGQTSVEIRLASELSHVENLVRKVASDKILIDHFDYGNADAIKSELEKEVSKSGLEGFLAYDFQGDLLATNLPKELSQFSKIIAEGRPDARVPFSSKLIWLEPSLYVIQKGLVGRLANPSGIIAAISRVSDILLSSLEGQPGLIGCWYVSGRCFSVGGTVQSLNSFDIARIPKDLAKSRPSWSEQFGGDKSFRISALISSAPLMGDVYLLSTFTASFWSAEVMTLALYGLSIGIILYLLLLPLSIIPANSLIADLKSMQKYLIDGVGNRNNKSLVPEWRSNGSETLFRVIQTRIDERLETEATLNAERSNFERMNQRINDLESIDDPTFKIFMGHMLSSLSQVAPAIEKMNSEAAVSRGLGALISVAENIRDDAIVFRLRAIGTHAAQAEDFLRKLLNSSLSVTPKMSGEIADLFAALATEVSAYRDLRGKFRGQNLSNLTISPTSPVQTNWLVSLAGRTFCLLQKGFSSPELVDLMHQEFIEATIIIGKVDIRTYIAGYDQLILLRQERLGSRVKKIEFSGNHFYFGEDRMQAINSMLVPCLRNVLDHGIENAPLRMKNGKPAEGTIRILSETVGESVEITVSDDGRGMDPEKIRILALEEGLLASDEAAPLELNDLLRRLMDHYKTVVAKNEGLVRLSSGFHALIEAVLKVGGDLEIISRPKRGTSIKLIIPDIDRSSDGTEALFDLPSLVRTAFSRAKPQLDLAGIRLTELAPPLESMLIFANKGAVSRTLDDIFSAILETKNRIPSLNISFGRSHLIADDAVPEMVSLVIELGGDSPKSSLVQLTQSTVFRNAMERLMGEPGLNGRILVKTGAIAIDLVDRVPDSVKGLGINILCLIKIKKDLMEQWANYSSKHAGGIKINFFSQDELVKFIYQRNLTPSILLVAGEAFASLASLVHEHGLLAETTILFSDDLSQLPTDILGLVEQNPLLVQGGMDLSAISYALDLAVARFLSRNEPSPDLNVNLTPSSSL
jgi:signal transduction histidine kinase